MTPATRTVSQIPRQITRKTELDFANADFFFISGCNSICNEKTAKKFSRLRTSIRTSLFAYNALSNFHEHRLWDVVPNMLVRLIYSKNKSFGFCRIALI